MGKVVSNEEQRRASALRSHMAHLGLNQTKIEDTGPSFEEIDKEINESGTKSVLIPIDMSVTDYCGECKFLSRGNNQCNLFDQYLLTVGKHNKTDRYKFHYSKCEQCKNFSTKQSSLCPKEKDDITGNSTILAVGISPGANEFAR